MSVKSKTLHFKILWSKRKSHYGFVLKAWHSLEGVKRGRGKGTVRWQNTGVEMQCCLWNMWASSTSHPNVIANPDMTMRQKMVEIGQ